MLRYAHNTFRDVLTSTIGVDFALKTIDVDDTTSVKLQLWDTAGQEKFYSLVTSYLRSCCVFFLVFDLTKWDSFTSVALWLTRLRTCRETHATSCTIVLLGNMADQRSARAVPHTVAQQWASENEIAAYYEVSAKTGEGVANAFEKTIQRLASDLPRMCEANVTGVSVRSATPDRASIRVEQHKKGRGVQDCC